ncbi:uncharacterized protein LOC142329678 isoform X2 [Lycorma delicatula]|uniref:uncharacterized protein LOC142329678 isoform X2 n=1 Tax=Lycorma delicatula TaxID=130591 RepID=UPI003F512D0B
MDSTSPTAVMMDMDNNMYFDDLHRHMFDDDDDDVLRSHPRGRSDLRAHLDDLARRHPEFAEHLRSPPGWVSDFHSGGGHSGSSSSSGHFREGGGYFGDSEPSNNQNQPQNHHQHQQQQQQQQPEEQQPNWYSPSQENIRENKVGNDNTFSQSSVGRDNLSQHGLRNTDPEIGLKGQAAAKEDRNQRSMSAPPDGRSQMNTDKPQRFVSKIEINPVNPATGQCASSNNDSAGKPPMAPPKHQQSQPQQQVPPPPPPPPQQKHSTVRHIPIFVEGRDEPVLPKNVEQEFTIPTSKQQHFSSPQQHFHHQQQPSQFGPQQHHNHPQQSQAPPPQQSNRKQSEQQPQHPQNQHQENPQKQQPQTEKTQKINDPIFQVQLIQKEVDKLRQKINDFKGNSRSDKEFIYLDEMLTRNLIKLDNIETEGKENVRATRKEAIKCIQQCISLLESKVPQTPVTQTPSSSNIIADNEESNNKMDVDCDNKTAVTNNNSDESKNNNKKCNDNSCGIEKENTSPAKELCGNVQKMDTDEHNNESSNKICEDDKMSVNEEKQQQIQKDVPSEAETSKSTDKSSDDKKEVAPNASTPANTTTEVKC